MGRIPSTETINVRGVIVMINLGDLSINRHSTYYLQLYGTTVGAQNVQVWILDAWVICWNGMFRLLATTARHSSVLRWALKALQVIGEISTTTAVSIKVNQTSDGGSSDGCCKFQIGGSKLPPSSCPNKDSHLILLALTASTVQMGSPAAQENPVCPVGVL